LRRLDFGLFGYGNALPGHVCPNQPGHFTLNLLPIRKQIPAIAVSSVRLVSTIFSARTIAKRSCDGGRRHSGHSGLDRQAHRARPDHSRRRLDTFDPLDARVVAWWKAKVDELYQAIPDLGGLVKL
jgi:hypothetical protein